MKKLMFAFSAMALGATVFAAVESDNVVGYVNKDNTSYQYYATKFFCPCFIKTGNTVRETSLADISIGGYKDSNGNYIELVGDYGVERAVTFARINNNGATLMQTVDDEDYAVEYYWNDTPDYEAGWYDDNDVQLKDGEGSLWGDAANIKFSNGNGVRAKVSGDWNDGDDVVPFTINFAGQVVKGDVEVSTYTPYQTKAAGNPTPTNVRLSQMTVTGYLDDNGDYIESVGAGGVERACTIAKINNNGATLMQTVGGKDYAVEYYWNDTPDYAAGWYDDNDTPMTEEGGSMWGDAANIVYGPGEGFRVKMSGDYEDEGGDSLQFNLKFPSALD